MSKILQICFAIFLIIICSTTSPTHAVFAQSDPIEGRKLGNIVIHIVHPKDTPDDGYWAWVQDYSTDFENYQREVDEARVILSAKAEQAAKLRIRWLKLFKAENLTYT